MAVALQQVQTESTWVRIDAAYECYQQGCSVEEIARAANKSESTIKGWILTAETFPPGIRSSEIPPSTYKVLASLPNPWEAAVFAKKHKLSHAKAIGLNEQWQRYKRRERIFPSGEPFDLTTAAVRARIIPDPGNLSPLAALTVEIQAAKKESQELRKRLLASEKIRLVYLKELGRKNRLASRRAIHV